MINEYNILTSAKFFANDGSQFFLIFQPISQTFRMLTGWNNHTMKMPRIVKSAKSTSTPANTLAPKLKCVGNAKRVVEFKESFLKHCKTTFTYANAVN